MRENKMNNELIERAWKHFIKHTTTSDSGRMLFTEKPYHEVAADFATSEIEEAKGKWLHLMAQDLADIDRLTADNERYVKALLECAIPLEALYNEPPHPTISPSMNEQIEKAVMMTRHIVIKLEEEKNEE